jgi:hypothetical protein
MRPIQSGFGWKWPHGTGNIWPSSTLSKITNHIFMRFPVYLMLTPTGRGARLMLCGVNCSLFMNLHHLRTRFIVILQWSDITKVRLHMNLERKPSANIFVIFPNLHHDILTPKIERFERLNEMLNGFLGWGSEPDICLNSRITTKLIIFRHNQLGAVLVKSAKTRLYSISIRSRCQLVSNMMDKTQYISRFKVVTNFDFVRYWTCQLHQV